VPAQNLAVKAIITPVLIGGASLAGRRFGHHLSGWLVALPMTSGPVAFFLVTDRGVSFAAGAAVGMLAGTISQVAFALAYSSTARKGATRAFFSGTLGFAAATIALSFVHWPALETFGFVLVSLAGGYIATRRRRPALAVEPPSTVPRWDIPVRMVAATTVVLLITTLAPFLGSHLAGLLSPLPVFGAVLALFTHRTHGARAATQALDGLLLGLIAPAVFFLALALALPAIGLSAFVLASVAAFGAQGVSMLAIPRDAEPRVP
jgi:hypothetical protein